MPDNFAIEIKGLDKLVKAFHKFPREIAKDMSQAGHEAGKEIIETEGLQDYPGRTKANLPPTPYYIRGTGTQYKSYNKGESENMKHKWYVRKAGYTTKIGNTASYAKWAHDDKLQAQAMAKIGWRKLREVAIEKMPKVTKIYQKWVDRTIKRLGL